jgi:hypothetical protein
MLPGDVDYSDSNVRVFTRGIRQTVQALEAAGVDTQDLKDVMRRIGEPVLRSVRPPVRSGRLLASMRLSPTKQAVRIRLGGARVPYAPRIEFGLRKFQQEGHHFLFSAVQAQRGPTIRRMVDELTKLMHKHDLGDPPIKVTGYVRNEKYKYR